MVDACFAIRLDRPVGDTVRVVVTGQADLASSDVLFAALAEAVAIDGVRHVDVDLTGVDLLDAAAVGVLLAVRHRAQRRRTTLRVTGAAGLPLQVLEITGVLGLLGGKSETGPGS